MPDSIRQRRMAVQDYRESSARVQTGFLAQEVERACQELNFEFSGLHVPESAVDNYGLAYASFVPLLVKRMQEQQVLIEAQQAIRKKRNSTPRLPVYNKLRRRCKRRGSEYKTSAGSTNDDPYRAV